MFAYAENLGFQSAFMSLIMRKKMALCPGPMVVFGGCCGNQNNEDRNSCSTTLYAPLKLAEDIAVLDNVAKADLFSGWLRAT